MSDKILPITYLNGVLLGVNAIQDAYLWIDAPDCFFFKVDHIQGNHDLNSSLRRANGEHKILSTISDVDNVIGNRNDRFVRTLGDMASRSFTNLIFVSSMPMSQLVGVDYGGLIARVRQDYPKSIFHIPSRSMTGCWVDGYDDLLFSLSKHIDITAPTPRKDTVAIVGNLFDRNEGDCIGNVEELRHIFEGLGIQVASVWLDGGDYASVLKVQEASTIISLPYGRRAAKRIASRLGVPVLELDLPFGIENTISFIREVGRNFSKPNELVEDFIGRELSERNNITSMKWGIHRILFDKKISFFGDPYLLNGMIDFSEIFGMRLEQVLIHGTTEHLNNYKTLRFGGVVSESALPDTDLFVMSSGVIALPDTTRQMEFGFPSYHHHCFGSQPYYGIRGGINFVNRLYNSLAA